jgi:hypothetical protein
MNAKLSKAVRRIARTSGLPTENQYLIHKRTGVIRLGRCRRGLVRSLKRRIARGEVKGVTRYTLDAALHKEAHAARVGS